MIQYEERHAPIYVLDTCKSIILKIIRWVMHVASNVSEKYIQILS
jgi:hypothetical protein